MHITFFNYGTSFEKKNTATLLHLYDTAVVVMEEEDERKEEDSW